MPSKPAVYSPHPRRPAPSEVNRPTRQERGYSERWLQFRKSFLAAHPLCIPCKDAGRVTEAVDLHHIDGKGPLGPRGYDPDNILPACHSCHSKITAREKRTR